eukprot:TRINITY_DN12564_c0_g1_i1.p1 TRINITY_DN12564_c0_g1~~TRINITY_DN12564_c0_g1_i1.p1  ORF type:complete len:1004 (+),score=190.43 TRINITY_DN12564_c0_g1_i1:411-3014(+)
MGDFICMLSDIYFTLAETRKAQENDGKAETWVPPSAFVRSTRKYWVRLEDLTRLKLHICKHLPLLRFGKRQGVNISSGSDRGRNLDYSKYDNSYNGNGEGDASKITSVYFDNDKLRLYHDKIVRKEGATLIRIRWYGEEGKTCFMERKTWHDSWVLNDSIKERFDIKWGEVPGYLTGETPPKYFVDKLKGSAKYDHKGLCELLGLAETVQHRILKLQLHPAIRTTYYRTAFQNSDNNNIRISIDTSLELTKEPKDPGPGRWCRDRTKPIHPEDRFVFPMAVLEIKLHSITDVPDWISEIVNADYVVGAYKFSKFMHGTAKLNGLKTNVLPVWFNRTATHVPGHPLKHWYRQSTNLMPNKMDFDGVKEWENQQEGYVPQIYLRNNQFDGKESDWSSDSDDELEQQIESQESESGLQMGLLSGQPQREMRVHGLYDDEDEFHKEENKQPVKTVLVTGTVEKGGPNLLEAIRKKKKPRRVGVTPVLQARRKEPKTNLALERTFLSWQRTFAYLAALALALIVVAPPPHDKFVLNLAVLSIIVGLYGLGAFLFRRKAIKVRSVDGHFDDKYGPTIMVFIHVLALVILLIWQFKLVYILEVPAPGAQPWMRDYKVPISVEGLNSQNIQNYLSDIMDQLKAAVPQFNFIGTLSHLKGTQTFSIWDTVKTCRLRNNGYVLQATSSSQLGSNDTSMYLQYNTPDRQVLKQMDTSYPFADYINSEVFRPPNHFSYGRGKQLAVSPEIDIYRLLHVAQLFEPFYLWDFTNNATFNERIAIVGGEPLYWQLYGPVTVELGLQNTVAQLNAYVWYRSSDMVPVHAELSLSYPIVPTHNITIPEIINSLSLYNALKNTREANATASTVEQLLYSNSPFCM